MAVPYQIIPSVNYPHVETHINDYTEWTELDASSSGTAYMLFVINAPRGIDGKLQTLTGGFASFINAYGKGSYAKYGQPYMNAYAAAQSGAAILHVLRVTAANATYANIHVCAKYRVVNDGDHPTMEVSFYGLTTDNLTDLDNLDILIENVLADTPETDEWQHLHLFTVACKGKGEWGNKLAFNISNDAASDKQNDYKNYTFTLYESNNSVLEIKDRKYITIDPEAIIGSQSTYMDDVINSDESGLADVMIQSSPDSWDTLWEVYQEVNPDTNLTRATFDPLLGIDKSANEAIKFFSINNEEAGSFLMNNLLGVALLNGGDGDFASTNKAVREAALEEAYQKAWSGETDPFIKSKNKYPTNLILDANYSVECKKLMATLATTRKDCRVILDMGINLNDRTAPLTFNAQFGDFVNTDRHTVDCWHGQVTDPVSHKTVTVTCTHKYASAIPLHWQEFGGKHVPYAGINFAKLTGYKNIAPLYDEDVDSEIMEKLTDARINFARVSAVDGIIVRGSQDTRQVKKSDMSEESMVQLLLDIKRDVERYAETLAYKFSEDSDLAMFNKDIEQITEQYAYAQVRSIEAEFGKSEWEAQRNIIHLYVTLSHRDIIKTVIIEIDVV